MNEMTHKEYLRSEEWKQLREQALERDGHRCRLCNSSENLNVHHRVYPSERNDWSTDCLDSITTLCKKCHTLHHSNNEDLENAFDVRGYISYNLDCFVDEMNDVERTRLKERMDNFANTAKAGLYKEHESLSMELDILFQMIYEYSIIFTDCPCSPDVQNKFNISKITDVKEYCLKVIILVDSLKSKLKRFYEVKDFIENFDSLRESDYEYIIGDYFKYIHGICRCDCE